MKFFALAQRRVFERQLFCQQLWLMITSKRVLYDVTRKVMVTFIVGSTTHARLLAANVFSHIKYDVMFQDFFR